MVAWTYEKSLDELTFADDLVFEKVMSDVNFAKILLQRIIGCRIKEITKHITQRVNDNGPEIHGSRFCWNARRGRSHY